MPGIMDPRRQGLLAGAFQGLQASGPRTGPPASLGQIIGQAGQAGMQQMNRAATVQQEMAIRQQQLEMQKMLREQQMLRAKQEAEEKQRVSGILEEMKPVLEKHKGSPPEVLQSALTQYIMRIDPVKGFESLNKTNLQMDKLEAQAKLWEQRARDKTASDEARHQARLGEITARSLLSSVKNAGDNEAQTWTDEEISALATAAIKDKSMLTGLSRTAQGNALLRRVLKAMSAIEVAGGDIVGRRASFQADQQSLMKMVPVYDSIIAFENNASMQGQALLKLGKSVDKTGIPAIEALRRRGAQALGDPQVSAFNAQLQVYSTEVAKILTNPNLSGVLTDDSRREIQEFLSKGVNYPQLESMVKLLDQDFGRRKKSLQDQMDAIRRRQKTGYAAGTATAEGQKPSGEFEEGKIYQDANGNKAVYRNGKWEEVK